MYYFEKYTLVASLLSTIVVVHACYHGELDSRALSAMAAAPPPTVQVRNYTRPPPKRIALRNVKVFDGSQILPPSTVVIDGDKIGLDDTRVDETVDGEGGVLLPGLFDAHLHPTTIGDLEALISYGVTTALSMSCWPIDVCNSLRGQVGLADFYTAGDSATSPNSSHARRPGFPQDQLIRSPADASWFVANRVGNGSDYIKVVAEPGGMTQAEHNALVAESHKFGMQVMTHVTGFNAYQMAIQSKSDIIQHLPADFPVNETMARTMLAQKQVSCPTLTVDKATVDTYHPAGWTYSTSVQSLRTLYAAGVPILAGTDSNDASNTTTASSGSVGIPIAFGAALHGELELLKEAGMPTVEILRAATSRPACYFGLHDRGIIAPGRRADLLLIRGDPIANISKTRNIMRVWTAGIEYEAVAKP